MFRPKDKVRIRATHVHEVKGYQLKALLYRRLVGEVIEVNGSACRVDFSQKDYPLLPVDGNGERRLPGQSVRLNKSSGLFRPDGFFSFKMLERAP